MHFNIITIVVSILAPYLTTATPIASPRGGGGSFGGFSGGGGGGYKGGSYGGGSTSSSSGRGSSFAAGAATGFIGGIWSVPYIHIHHASVPLLTFLQGWPWPSLRRRRKWQFDPRGTPG